MHRKKLYILLAAGGFLVLTVCGVALATPQPASAQCGSQASSCRNCHEVQAQDPVNADGTGWHQSHAFGDFCYICHGGNNQATEKDAAHTAMVAPLEDVNAACQQCHPNDLDERAQVYAVALGAPVGHGGASASTQGAAPAASPTPGQPAPAAVEPPAAAASTDSTNLVDYVQRYDELVLGKHPTNWGNVILLVLLVGMALAGAFLVARKEGLMRVSFRETAELDKELPADVVELASNAARMKPAARKSLGRLLRDPQKATKAISALDQLCQDDSSEQDK